MPEHIKSAVVICMAVDSDQDILTWIDSKGNVISIKRFTVTKNS